MLVLSIDCAGSGCGVCLWQDGKILAARDERMERGQDQRLMPLILEMMTQAGFGFERLDRIAVTRGPGSFTGLRIGLAAARGIGLASAKPVIGIDRFAIYHEHVKDCGKNVLVIINSRRNELYCRYYPVSEKPHEATMMTAEEIGVFLKDKSNYILVGDVSPDLFKSIAPPTESEHITSAKLAAVAPIGSPDYLPRPLYIRAPDVTLSKKSSDVIRPLTLDQAIELAELHAESFGEGRWDAQQIKGSLALDSNKGWGVYENDSLVGFILCQIIQDQSEILTLCVNSKYRKQGHGEKLVRAAIQAARTSDSNLHLEVAADNVEALGLYKKLGFHQSGKRPNYYRHSNGNIDAIMLTLKVA